MLASALEPEGGKILKNIRKPKALEWELSVIARLFRVQMFYPVSLKIDFLVASEWFNVFLSVEL